MLLLMVTAVATILITPSTADDVPGVMHRSHTPMTPAVLIGLMPLASIARSIHLLKEVAAHELLQGNLLEFECQHIC